MTKGTFIVFAGSNYYPGGGTSDYEGIFDSIAAAQQHVANGFWDDELHCEAAGDERGTWDWAEIVTMDLDGLHSVLEYNGYAKKWRKPADPIGPL